MAKNLVIVESPAKSRTLARFLGKNYSIMSTVGHLVDLPKSSLGVDPENGFEPAYTVIAGKEKVLADLKKAAKKMDNVFLAPDPDREGEAIAWHVANELAGIKAKIHRVTFNEITKTAVTEAINSPRNIDEDLVNAQQARRVLDRLVGYMVSPFLWKTIARNLSAGRVQSVALRLICERDEEIVAFKSNEYWKIQADMATKTKEKFGANLFKIDSKSVVKGGEKGKNKIVISSKNESDKIQTDLKKQKWSVASVTKTKQTRKSPAPFITSTLQQEAAKAFGYSPSRTMSLAQKLYEGIEIGKKGAVGLITYMRTDSTRVSQEALTAVRKFIKSEYGKEFLPDKPNVYSKKKSAQDAHEAIRPTYLDLTPDKVKKSLTPQQFKLYKLIWNRFLASQMKAAVFDAVTIDIEGGKYIFRANARQINFAGFLKIYHEEKEMEDNTNGDISVERLPNLKKGDTVKLLKLNPTQSFTKPPARYSEAMLVKRLEADGIGRPSTYAAIIGTLKQRKYVELFERRLNPTDLGKAVSSILVEHFPALFNVKFTAGMEKELDLIEEGVDDWVKVLTDFYGPFNKTINSLKGKEQKIKESMVKKTDQKCDKCKKPMVIKWGRNGQFLACSGWPDCKSTRPLPEEEARSKTDQKCEKCGSPMVIKTGRFGRFMACSAYPDCKNTKAITLGIKCPKINCGGEVLEKTTKTRRTFYGCTKYPKCDFASWDKPINKPCPVCKHAYMLQKVSKAKGEFLRCPECKNDVMESIEKEGSAA